MSWIVPFQNESDKEGADVVEAYLAALNGPVLPLSTTGARGKQDPREYASRDLATLRHESLDLTHSRLVRVAYLREIIYQLLKGRSITIVEDAKRKGVSPVYLKLDKGLTSADFQGWFTLPPKGNDTFSLLTDASKMACPSFSLPAGVPAQGGSCPAAVLQSIVPATGKVAKRGSKDPHLKSKLNERVEKLTGEPADLARSVCQMCVSGDMRVLVKGRGLVALKDLQEPCTVWSGQAWRETYPIRQGKQRVVNVSTSWGLQLVVTPDHKVLTRDGMKEAQSLEPGDQLVSTLPAVADYPFPESALIPKVDSGTRTRFPVVCEVSDAGTAEVFDLVNVGPERQFLANGLVVSNCYAETGSYSYVNVQLAQVVRLLWTHNALQDQENGGDFSNYFVRVMVHAIQNATYNPTDVKVHKRRFFRIHDSGDFFSPEYLAGWIEVAQALPDTIFWAPTRIWSAPGKTAWERVLREVPPNLVVRPSAYMVDNPGPRGLRGSAGYAATTTVYQQGAKSEGEDPHQAKVGTDGLPLFDWDCRAYAVLDEAHNCVNAERPLFGSDGQPVRDEVGRLVPSGEKGCRACWLARDASINYTLH